MANMLGKSASKLVDVYQCCERHNPGGKQRGHQSARRREDREWRRDQDEPEPEYHHGREVCPCLCHWDPDHCAICDNDYADLCSPVAGVIHRI